MIKECVAIIYNTVWQNEQNSSTQQTRKYKIKCITQGGGILRCVTETFVQRPTRAAPRLETRVVSFHRRLQSPSQTVGRRVGRPQSRPEDSLPAALSEIQRRPEEENQLLRLLRPAKDRRGDTRWGAVFANVYSGRIQMGNDWYIKLSEKSFFLPQSYLRRFSK